MPAMFASAPRGPTKAERKDALDRDKFEAERFVPKGYDRAFSPEERFRKMQNLTLGNKLAEVRANNEPDMLRAQYEASPIRHGREMEMQSLQNVPTMYGHDVTRQLGIGELDLVAQKQRYEQSPLAYQRTLGQQYAENMPDMSRLQWEMTPEHHDRAMAIALEGMSPEQRYQLEAMGVLQKGDRVVKTYGPDGLPTGEVIAPSPMTGFMAEQLGMKNYASALRQQQAQAVESAKIQDVLGLENEEEQYQAAKKYLKSVPPEKVEALLPQLNVNVRNRLLDDAEEQEYKAGRSSTKDARNLEYMHERMSATPPATPSVPEVGTSEYAEYLRQPYDPLLEGKNPLHGGIINLPKWGAGRPQQQPAQISPAESPTATASPAPTLQQPVARPMPSAANPNKFVQRPVARPTPAMAGNPVQPLAVRRGANVSFGTPAQSSMHQALQFRSLTDDAMQANQWLNDNIQLPTAVQVFRYPGDALARSAAMKTAKNMVQPLLNRRRPTANLAEAKRRAEERKY
jgi:hypothetical protein